MARRYHQTRPGLGVIAGVICGFFIGAFVWSYLSPTSASCQDGGCCAAGGEGPRAPGGLHDAAGPKSSESDPTRWMPDSKEEDGQRLLLVGVMTAKKYLNSRVIAAYDTWASKIPGRVIFFSSEGSSLPERPDIPIIALPGVADTYPPQKKSFLMFKYMHDRFLNKFEWFMRADDDVYVKGDKMATFLHSINSSRTHFIGQAGLGTKEEFGQLSLEQDMNFCMGGPGMVLSQATLSKMAPHVSYCLKNLYTTHEDVEVGRCLRKFAETPCTWAFEVRIYKYTRMEYELFHEQLRKLIIKNLIYRNNGIFVSCDRSTIVVCIVPLVSITDVDTHTH